MVVQQMTHQKVEINHPVAVLQKREVRHQEAETLQKVLLKVHQKAPQKGEVNHPEVMLQKGEVKVQQEPGLKVHQRVIPQKVKVNLPAVVHQKVGVKEGGRGLRKSSVLEVGPSVNVSKIIS